MVLALRHSDTLRVQQAHHIVASVVHEQLVDALTHLSLPVVHEAAAEGYYLAAVDDCCVAATALNSILIVRPIIDVAPLSETIVRARAGHNTDRCYLLVRVVVLSTDEVDLRAYRHKARVLSWRRQPILQLNMRQLSEEALALLHALHVRLEAARQPLRELVARDIVRRLRSEQLRAVDVVIA